MGSFGNFYFSSALKPQMNADERRLPTKAWPPSTIGHDRARWVLILWGLRLREFAIHPRRRHDDGSRSAGLWPAETRRAQNACMIRSAPEKRTLLRLAEPRSEICISRPYSDCPLELILIFLTRIWWDLVGFGRIELELSDSSWVEEYPCNCQLAVLPFSFSLSALLLLAPL